MRCRKGGGVGSPSRDRRAGVLKSAQEMREDVRRPEGGTFRQPEGMEGQTVDGCGQVGL